jgi:hypothetical protein
MASMARVISSLGLTFASSTPEWEACAISSETSIGSNNVKFVSASGRALKAAVRDPIPVTTIGSATIVTGPSIWPICRPSREFQIPWQWMKSLPSRQPTMAQARSIVTQPPGSNVSLYQAA